MEGKQEQFKLSAPIDSGEDEHGPFDIIPLAMVTGGELKPTKVYKDPLKHIVNESNPTIRGWYKSKHEGPRVRPRPCYTEALLTTPYGGFCHVGCKFCYVDHGTRGYRATGLSTASPSYPDHVRKQVAEAQICPAAYISSFTEPFQKLEDRYGITKRLSQVFVDEGLPLFYLSRKLVPTWAIENLLQNPYSYMQWSINTSSEDIYRKLSPGSYRISDVLKQIEYMSGLGIYVSIQCNPILPGIVSLDDLVELVELLSQAGADHIIFKFVEQVFNKRNLLLNRLSRLPGVEKLNLMMSQTIGGVYTIDQEVRIQWLDELLEATRANGMTMSTCYEYYQDGGAGANMAPFYTTSDQCHGRGVPVHYRPEPGAEFMPFPCYRKGCLYCKDAGPETCRNDTLLEARALTYKDYRTITIVEPEGGWDWSIPDACARPDDIESYMACNPFNEDGLPMTDAAMWGWERPW